MAMCFTTAAGVFAWASNLVHGTQGPKCGQLSSLCEAFDASLLLMLACVHARCLWHQVGDDPRQADVVCPAPHGPLVAITDNMGRVLLADAAQMVLMRMWKVGGGGVVICKATIGLTMCLVLARDQPADYKVAVLQHCIPAPAHTSPPGPTPGVTQDTKRCGR
jgi:hypothetical protein